MIDTTISVHGVEKLVGGLTAMSKVLRNPAKLFERIEADFYAMQRERFAGGDGWQRLAEATVQRKIKLGLDPRVLIASGDLERSLTQQGATHQVRRIGADSIELGTNRPGAAAHQDSRRSWLPVRKLIDIGSDDISRWKSFALVAAVEAFNGSS